MPYRDSEAQKKYQRDWYQRKKQQHLECVRARRRRIQDWLNEQKSQPCADCSRTFPPVCMDFHHVDGQKEFSIARMVRDIKSMPRIVAEVEKCVVICSNCHRLRHYS